MPEKNGTTANIISGLGGYRKTGEFADARDDLRVQCGMPPMGRQFDDELYEKSEKEYAYRKARKEREKVK